MSSAIKVYRYGLHRGEEALVAGNAAAGMVNFSGCHLSCNFCYTPETSVQKLGTDMTTEEFLHILQKLSLCGAGNINLISPTHLWKWIEPALRAFRNENSRPLPLVLKVSGFESAPLVERMAQVADVFVPDFKVWSEAAATRVGLPANYGEVALFAIRAMGQTHPNQMNADGKLSRGILVRHLLMPGYLEESRAVVRRLGEIEFAGALNLMTQFFDPTTRKLVRASQSDVHALSILAAQYSYTLMVDGKVKEIVHA